VVQRGAPQGAPRHAGLPERRPLRSVKRAQAPRRLRAREPPLETPPTEGAGIPRRDQALLARGHRYLVHPQLYSMILEALPPVAESGMAPSLQIGRMDVRPRSTQSSTTGNTPSTCPIREGARRDPRSPYRALPARRPISPSTSSSIPRCGEPPCLPSATPRP